MVQVVGAKGPGEVDFSAKIPGFGRRCRARRERQQTRKMPNVERQRQRAEESPWRPQRQFMRYRKRHRCIHSFATSHSKQHNASRSRALKQRKSVPAPSSPRKRPLGRPGFRRIPTDRSEFRRRVWSGDRALGQDQGDGEGVVGGRQGVRGSQVRWRFHDIHGIVAYCFACF